MRLLMDRIASSKSFINIYSAYGFEIRERERETDWMEFTQLLLQQRLATNALFITFPFYTLIVFYIVYEINIME